MAALGKEKYIAILSAASLAAPLLCHIACASPKAINITPAKTTRSITKQKSVDSEASAGVQLLESILQRLHNIPQLALVRSQQALQSNSTIAMQQGANQSDPNLLIRPKDLSRVAQKLRAMTESLAQQMPSSGVRIASATTMAKPAETASNETISMAPRRGTIWERSDSDAMMADDKSAASAPAQTSANASADEEALGNGPVIKEYGNAKGMMMPGLNARERERSAQLINDGIAKANSPAFANLAKTLNGTNLALDQPSARDTRPAYKKQIVAAANNMPTSNIAGKNMAANSIAMSNVGGYATGVKSLAGMAGSYSKQEAETNKGKSARWEFAPNVYRGEQSAKRSEASNLKDARKAPSEVDRFQSQSQGLVPTPPQAKIDLMSYLPALAKFTAVPPVRLGDTENEISHPLMDMGTVRREVVNNWTVFSVHKNKSKNISMQVFLKAGNVDAILVMDPSIWTAQQGVTIGDALPAIKQKFGEPAFIVSAEHNSAVQNYIYPISQVGFQLQSDNDNDMPKVKSILIFNVK